MFLISCIKYGKRCPVKYLNITIIDKSPCALLLCSPRCTAVCSLSYRMELPNEKWLLLWISYVAACVTWETILWYNAAIFFNINIFPEFSFAPKASQLTSLGMLPHGSSLCFLTTFPPLISQYDIIEITCFVMNEQYSPCLKVPQNIDSFVGLLLKIHRLIKCSPFSLPLFL